MSGLCEGRVCVVTGAGRGLGRAYAIRLAREGAAVVVNDVGAGVDGDGVADEGPADQVVEEIVAEGGRAVVDGHDVADWEGARALIAEAVERFGRVDVVVNNAGILRDRMMVNVSEEDFDSVVRVHLKGTFAVSHHVANYWRRESKEGRYLDARLINTTSVSGLFGNVGQANYAAAKAGIASFTLVASMELARYGVTVNAVSPGALTRMTEGLRQLSDGDKEQRSPEWPAAVVAWLASPHSGHVTGRVILTSGRRLAIAEGWVAGPATQPSRSPGEVGTLIEDLLTRARPNADMGGAVK